jgi:hypothetical protein
MRSTCAANSLNSTTNSDVNNQQFELEAEALVNMVNKLVNQIEERLKGKKKI